LEKQLHVLFNNAGVLSTNNDQKTLDGYELHWGTNGRYIAFLEDLLEKKKSAKKFGVLS